MVYVRKTNRKIRSNKGKPRKHYKKRSSKKKRSVERRNFMDAPNPMPNNKDNSEDLVEIMTPRKQIVKLPRSYPGDVWVHQYLIEDNNYPIEYYQKYHDYIFNDTYMKYWNICYNKY